MGKNIAMMTFACRRLNVIQTIHTPRFVVGVVLLKNSASCGVVLHHGRVVDISHYRMMVAFVELVFGLLQLLCIYRSIISTLLVARFDVHAGMN